MTKVNKLCHISQVLEYKLPKHLMLCKKSYFCFSLIFHKHLHFLKQTSECLDYWLILKSILQKEFMN